MNHFREAIAILSGLLLFQLWNICTARRRGEIFVSFWTYSRSRSARDFKTAFFLNLVWLLVIVILIVLYITAYLRRRN